MGRAMALRALAGAAVAQVASAWSTDMTGQPMPCAHTEVLLDHASGWPAKCEGLSRVPDVGTMDACQQHCVADVTCSNWQFTDESVCWAGFGHNCATRDGDQTFNPLGGQRIQHGKVTVVKNLTAEWVPGLYNIGIPSSGDSPTNAERCKLQCYSDVLCRFWQYGHQGCWAERAGYLVPDGTLLQTSTDEALTMIGGQEIQHICPAKGDGVAAPQQGWVRDWVKGVLGLLLLLLCAICCIATQCHKKQPTAKRTRAVRAVNKEERDNLDYSHPVYASPVYATGVVPVQQTYQPVMTEVVEFQPLLQQGGIPTTASFVPTYAAQPGLYG